MSAIVSSQFQEATPASPPPVSAGRHLSMHPPPQSLLGSMTSGLLPTLPPGQLCSASLEAQIDAADGKADLGEGMEREKTSPRGWRGWAGSAPGRGGLTTAAQAPGAGPRAGDRS